MARQLELQVGLFNSSTVLDDMAWGAAWLHKATGEAGYLGQAELFMSRHQQEEVVARSLHHTRQYYVPDWDNTAWAADMLLAAATQRPVYLSRIRKLLSTWLYAESLPTGPDLSGVQGNAPADELSRLEHFTPNGSAISFAVVPECKPTALYEVNCYDGIDDDCNGFVDRMDLA
ncbi:glyco_trans_2-like domain-containing protein, partial [Haematococcus lacustris]